jgi:hypothetical protein
MYKKIIPIFIAAFMMLSPVSAFAKGFSGGHSLVPHHRTSSFGGNGGFSSNFPSSGTYHSGYRSPSSKVNGYSSNHNSSYTYQNTQSYSNYNQPQTKKSGGFLSHALAFGAGTLLGGMLHPFGGAYGSGGYHGFSVMGLLMDMIVIGIGLLVLRRLFAK